VRKPGPTADVAISEAAPSKTRPRFRTESPGLEMDAWPSVSGMTLKAFPENRALVPHDRIRTLQMALRYSDKFMQGSDAHIAVCQSLPDPDYDSCRLRIVPMNTD
jgi:hypothetical protein